MSILHFRQVPYGGCGGVGVDVNRLDFLHMSRVNVKPIREGVERYVNNGGSYTRICEYLEWSKIDTNRLRRALGIITMSDGKLAQRINYESAVKIIRAIGDDPVDYGV